MPTASNYCCAGPSPYCLPVAKRWLRGVGHLRADQSADKLFDFFGVARIDEIIFYKRMMPLASSQNSFRSIHPEGMQTL